MKVGQYYQQGDVIVEKIGEVEDLEALKQAHNVTETIKNNTVAYGEVSGHSHRWEDPGVQTWKIPTPKDSDVVGELNTFLVCIPEEGGTLVHEEHGPIPTSPGVYTTRIVKEFDPFEKLTREVRD